MSGQGDCSHAFTMDLSKSNFHAVILCDFSWWQVLSGMLWEFDHLFFWEKPPAESTVTEEHREFHFG